ncbi:hypothetical protein FM107_02140 [Sphingobacterium sp. JB170]|nr:hypothetical protein FM107_02140 [Sphingobacterium sp. JB170]
MLVENKPISFCIKLKQKPIVSSLSPVCLICFLLVKLGPISRAAWLRPDGEDRIQKREVASWERNV